MKTETIQLDCLLSRETSAGLIESLFDLPLKHNLEINKVEISLYAEWSSVYAEHCFIYVLQFQQVQTAFVPRPVSHSAAHKNKVTVIHRQSDRGFAAGAVFAV